jgi:hypothetical protein
MDVFTNKIKALRVKLDTVPAFHKAEVSSFLCCVCVHGMIEKRLNQKFICFQMTITFV